MSTYYVNIVCRHLTNGNLFTTMPTYNVDYPQDCPLGAILRWAILSPSVIRNAHPNYYVFLWIVCAFSTLDDALMLVMYWCCWCTDARMLLNQDQDLLADLTIAICSSFQICQAFQQIFCSLYYCDQAASWHNQTTTRQPPYILSETPGTLLQWKILKKKNTFLIFSFQTFLEWKILKTTFLIFSFFLIQVPSNRIAKPDFAQTKPILFINFLVSPSAICQNVKLHNIKLFAV